MNPIQGKRILLGVTGSIAAYKTPHLVRLLKKNGAEVRVALTRAGADFVSPLTLSTLSEHPVAVEFVEGAPGSLWNNHVEWGMWADLVLVAPASANTLAQAAQGACNSFLSAVVLSAKCPVVWAPAMDLDMYRYPAVQNNLTSLAAFGHVVIPAATGSLASGLEGQGRMPEPEELVQHVAHFFAQKGPARGKKVLITLGPTHESWDSVRYLGNRSSGKMGRALAEAWAYRGAEVVALVGPGAEEPSFPSIRTIRIQTAEDLFQAVREHFPQVDAAFFSAAVADYRPARLLEGKHKKNGSPVSLDLVENPDSLAWAGANKKPHQRVVGFALEEVGALERGQEKMERKGCDALFFNELGHNNAGIGAAENGGIWLDETGATPLEQRPKEALAQWMVERTLFDWKWIQHD
jgi:phosphopantothenoylcysteine decarboxylase/phosphopantothenate--cysteine ligase